MHRRLAVIGHPLAAEENRLAFQGWNTFQVDLVVPGIWKSRSLGHTYHTFASKPGSPDSHKVEGAPSIHPLSVLAGGRNSLFLWLGLDGLLRRLKPDVIYCWEEPWCLSTWQIGRSARNLGVPLVFYSAENRPKRLPWPFASLQEFAYGISAGCVAPTDEIAGRVRASGFTGKVFGIPLWIRPRRPLRADADNRCLAYVGRLIPLKRVNLLIESLRFLPGFRLRIIGDGPERPALENLARGLGLADRVEFRGHLDNEELEDGLEGASLLVLPTAENPRQAEQFGKAALEGVSCGLPVLASRTGNLAVLAETIPTLTARDLDTAEQMAEAVMGLWSAYPKSEALEASRALVRKDYGSQSAARRLEAAFVSLLPRGGAG
jgi:glycosyltransferase involved in cell wall biosynthesis